MGVGTLGIGCLSQPTGIWALKMAALMVSAALDHH